jgi:predicted nucleic acid-binding protein
MTKKLKIYLDISVPSAYFDQKVPDRMERTKIFWGRLKDYQVYISDLVIDEINAIDDSNIRGLHQKRSLTELVKELNLLSSKISEIGDLANEYVNMGIIPSRYLQDAKHIATATFYSMDVLVSWNFEHMVKLKTKTEVNVVNRKLGFKKIEIVEPSML